MDLVERRPGTVQRHPWEVARAEFFLRLLRRNGLLEEDRNWLDAGAGDAWFARQLRRLLPPAASVTCWDINYRAEDLEDASQDPEGGVHLTAERPDKRFDRILMLDVIEHIEDDAGFVNATVDDLLSEDGIVLVSVPAHQALWSSHDSALRHYRRYAPAKCSSLLEAAGLVVKAEGGLFHSLLPLRFGQVVLERIRPRDGSDGIGDWQGGKLVTAAVTRALTADAALSLLLSRRGVALPGLSYWALCNRRRS
jgi:SAM-dependent methyltransferase